jgi:FkbM family methyltransferase
MDAASASVVGERQGRRIEVFYPDVANLRQHITSVLTGQEYPLIPLPGYEPQTIVDIGAHVGAASILFNCVYPQARLVCFEPSAGNFEYLRKNLANIPNAEIYPIGLSDRSGQRKLYRGVHHSMENSVVPSAGTTDDFEVIELRDAAGEFEARGLTDISILKIDTEGCELPILRTLRAWLGRIDLIYLEYHSDDDRRAIDQHLAEHFVMASSRAFRVHRGSALYLSRRIIDRYPWLDRDRIQLSSAE